jgi:hypothetical protein
VAFITAAKPMAAQMGATMLATIARVKVSATASGWPASSASATPEPRSTSLTSARRHQDDGDGDDERRGGKLHGRGR